MTLAALIAPLDEVALARRIAGRSVFALHGAAPEPAQALLPWEAIDLLTHNAVLPAENYYLGFRGGAVPKAAYRGTGGGLRRAVVQGFIDKGATLVFDDVGRYVPAIGNAAGALARLLSAAVRVNAYATHGAVSVFSPHEDPHDVLALQIFGAKCWRFPASACGSETLQPGSMLFVPHGTIHEATPLEMPSVHLTFGIAASSNRAADR